MRCVKVFSRYGPILVWLVWLSCVLVVFSALQAQNLSTTPAQERPQKYSQVRVYITSKDDILALAQAGLAVDHIDYHGTYFDVVFNNEEVAILRNMGKRYDVLVDDMEATYRQRPKMSRTQMQTLRAQMGVLYTTSPAIFITAAWAATSRLRKCSPSWITCARCIRISSPCDNPLAIRSKVASFGW